MFQFAIIVRIFWSMKSCWIVLLVSTLQIVRKIHLNTAIMTKISLDIVRNVSIFYEPVSVKISFAIMEKNLATKHVKVRSLLVFISAINGFTKFQYYVVIINFTYYLDFNLLIVTLIIFRQSRQCVVLQSMAKCSTRTQDWNSVDFSLIGINSNCAGPSWSLNQICL